MDPPCPQPLLKEATEADIEELGPFLGHCVMCQEPVHEQDLLPYESRRPLCCQRKVPEEWLPAFRNENSALICMRSAKKCTDTFNEKKKTGLLVPSHGIVAEFHTTLGSQPQAMKALTGKLTLQEAMRDVTMEDLLQEEDSPPAPLPSAGTADWHSPLARKKEAAADAVAAAAKGGGSDPSTGVESEQPADAATEEEEQGEQPPQSLSSITTAAVEQPRAVEQPSNGEERPSSPSPSSITISAAREQPRVEEQPSAGTRSLTGDYPPGLDGHDQAIMIPDGWINLATAQRFTWQGVHDVKGRPLHHKPPPLAGLSSPVGDGEGGGVGGGAAVEQPSAADTPTPFTPEDEVGQLWHGMIGTGGHELDEAEVKKCLLNHPAFALRVAASDGSDDAGIFFGPAKILLHKVACELAPELRTKAGVGVAAGTMPTHAHPSGPVPTLAHSSYTVDLEDDLEEQAPIVMSTQGDREHYYKFPFSVKDFTKTEMAAIIKKGVHKEDVTEMCSSGSLEYSALWVEKQGQGNLYSPWVPSFSSSVAVLADREVPRVEDRHSSTACPKVLLCSKIAFTVPSNGSKSRTRYTSHCCLVAHVCLPTCHRPRLAS